MGNFFKKFTNGLLQKFGYAVISLKGNQILENHLANLFQHLGINCVIDVGANAGQYGIMLRSLGYKGEILSFEPVPHVYKMLEAASKDDPKWKVYNFALGSLETKKEINVSNSSVFSSFLDSNDYGKATFDKFIDVDERLTVAVKTLDDFLTTYIAEKKGHRIYLKMDTQGFDFEVIKGCSEHLDKILALQSEISVIPIYDSMVSYTETLTNYEEIGFFVTGIFPVTREEKSLRVIEFDCVMTKQQV